MLVIYYLECYCHVPIVTTDHENRKTKLTVVAVVFMVQMGEL